MRLNGIFVSIEYLLKINCIEHLVGCSGGTLDIFACLLTRSGERGLVGNEAVHYLGKVVRAVDRIAATGSNEFLGFLELVVVRTEYYRHIPYSSLKHVVYAYSESSAYVGYITIFIYRGEESEAVDDEYLGILESLYEFIIERLLTTGLHCHHLGVSLHRSALQQGIYLLKMVFAYDVRRDDQLPVLMLLEVRNEYLLVGLP